MSFHKKLPQELESSQPNAKEESCISMSVSHSSIAPCHLIPSGTFKHYLIGGIKEQTEKSKHDGNVIGKQESGLGDWGSSCFEQICIFSNLLTDARYWVHIKSSYWSFNPKPLMAWWFCLKIPSLLNFVFLTPRIEFLLYYSQAMQCTPSTTAFCFDSLSRYIRNL